jgi:hypothetical protein
MLQNWLEREAPRQTFTKAVPMARRSDVAAIKGSPHPEFSGQDGEA